MEYLFKTKEASEVFKYLEENIGASVVGTERNLVHLAVPDYYNSIEVIGYTETVSMQYPDFFEKVGFLFELEEGYKLMFRGDLFLADLLKRHFGGHQDRLYWIIQDKIVSIYSYNDVMPTAAEVKDFIINISYGQVLS